MLVLPIAMQDDPLQADASELSRRIHARELSCAALMQATLARIHAFNPAANALVNLRPDAELLAEAAACDAELAAGRSRGWLHGLPAAIKDTAHATGLPTTWGTPLLAQAIAAQDSLHVARLKAAGAVVVAKTNMPELGLGSHTDNALFGATRNALLPQHSAGGSSGGAAVALALRLVAVADGSDYMGSLRNPAAWNGVWGLRPSQGRVPGWPLPDPWLAQIGTPGPMARSVRDLGRLLATMAGPDPRAPLALAAPFAWTPPADEATALAALRGVRIGWLGDLGGHLANEPGILAGNEAALARLQAAGARVDPVAPGFDAEAVWRAWCTWRHAATAPAVQRLLDRLPAGADPAAHIGPHALWEHAQAQRLRVADWSAAAEQRARFHGRMLALFERFDALALPVAQVWPFPLAQGMPRSVAGRAMDSYHRWMACTLYASFAGLPAASLPAGHDPAGRGPLALQLIGPPQGDAALLALAAAHEALHGGRTAPARG